MALFGLMKKKQMAAMPMQNANPFDTIGGRYGDFANQVEQDKMPMPQPQERHRPNILGIIGDSLQIMGGGQATYVPQMQRQRQMADMQRQKMEQTKIDRETEWQDYVRKREYERDNAAPVNNDTVNDFNFYKGLGQEDRDIYQQMRPQFIPDGFGGGKWATPSVGGQAPNAPSQHAPTFQGWADEGGQTPQASGNFRLR